MRARLARKILTEWQGGRKYRARTTRRAIGKYAQAVHRLSPVGVVYAPTRDKHTWRWAWQLRAAARSFAIRPGRLAWLALMHELARYVRAGRTDELRR